MTPMLQQKTEGKIVQGGQVLSLSSIGTAAQIEDQSSDLLAMIFLIGHEMPQNCPHFFIRLGHPRGSVAEVHGYGLAMQSQQAI